MNEPITIYADQWFNAPPEFSLDHVRGKVVLVHAFQLLCPGCVANAIPQIRRIEAVGHPQLAVIGVHTVFEHHDAMGPTVLSAFLHEYRIHHPVAVDARAKGKRIPKTMAALDLQGTPTLLLLDHRGCEIDRWFGGVDDIELGMAIGQALANTPR